MDFCEVLAEFGCRDMQARQEWEAQQQERQDEGGKAGDTDIGDAAPQFVAYVPLPTDQVRHTRTRAHTLLIPLC